MTRPKWPQATVTLLRRLMHAIQGCEEEEDEDGLCDCARAIGEELARERKRGNAWRRRALAAERQLRTTARREEARVT